ncbi:MAG: Ca2+-binding EF-hand superfamily protein [Planctomycetota bacterium]|jgi:Ca2+-binding EF-hand superfamily protein
MRPLLLILLALVLGLPARAATPVAPAPSAAPSMAPASAPAPQRRGNSRRSVKKKKKKKGGGFTKGPAVADLEIFKKGAKVLPAIDLASGSSSGAKRSRRKGTADVILPTEAQLMGWFGTSDANGSGWVSYRETAHALGFDRLRFRRFDEDRDGRVDLAEFELYCTFALTERTFRDPLPPADLLGAPTRTPEQLRNAYDRDRDGMLSASEIKSVLTDYSRSDLVSERVVMGLDRDGDGRLNVKELAGLEGLVGVVSASNVPMPSGLVVGGAKSAEELFGAVEPRAQDSNAPPRINGPVRSFRRLDLDNNGQISLDEMEELLRPLFSAVRVRTVHHTLDRNQDGVLTEDEFDAALFGKPLPKSGDR